MYLTTDQPINKMLINQQRICFVFQKEMRLVSPIIYGNQSHQITSASCMYSTCILCVSLCHVKCLGWHRCRHHSFHSHLACHLCEKSNPVCAHILLCASKGVISEKIFITWTSSDFPATLYLSLWKPVTKGVLLTTTLTLFPVKNLLRFSLTPEMYPL